MQSESIGELAKALAEAQSNITGAIKSKTNPFHKSNYADLEAVWDACRQQITKVGLCVTQTFDAVEKGIRLRTVLMHSSGQWIDSVIDMPVSKVDAQAYGSAATYARRYALAAIVGVAPEDDDGNAASGLKRPGTKDIQPDSGVWENVRADVATDLHDYANRMRAAVEAANVEEISSLQNMLREYSAEEQIAGWNLLDSKTRSTVKKIMKAREESQKQQETVKETANA